jgi:hypothetical protein
VKERAVQPKVFFLAIFLMIGSNGFSFARPIRTGMPTAESAGYRKTEQVTPSAEQRSLYGRCLYSAELAGRRGQSFLASVRRGHFDSDEVRRHLKEISLAVEEMLQVHDRFLKSLTEKQWTAATDEITKLERHRAAIHAQLRGIDYELQMPQPQAKVLTNYGKAIAKDLTDWRKLYRKIGLLWGMKLQNQPNE